MRLWPFGNRVQKLSNELSQELLKKFGIESEDAVAMRYVAKRGKLGSGQVDRVCIFDPAVLSVPELAAANYDRVMTSNKGLLFTGHIMKSPEFSNADVVVLHDRRGV